MIDLTQKQRIILDHLNGISNREIARVLHISKDTVNIYVKAYDDKRDELLAQDPSMDHSTMIQAFAEEPKFAGHPDHLR